MAQARVIKGKEWFKPVVIEVTLESQKELDFFGTIFNHTTLISSLKSNGVHNLCRPIREAVRSAGGCVVLVEKLAL